MGSSTEPAADRAPSTVWCFSRERMDTYVATAPGEGIIFVQDNRLKLEMSRKDARMLAKRLEQCLKGTAKR